MTDVNKMVASPEGTNGSDSEEAFTLLVRKHVDLVYSVALRHVGVPAQAEEITQVVFVILARKASALRAGTIIEGWLHKTTRLTALDFLRREHRRQVREKEAFMESSLHNQPGNSTWDDLAPLLDEAIAQLGARDRDAVMLRFFKGSSVREVAEALGINENAAQQRILRAVERMRSFFAKRGVVVPASVIGTAIAANSIKAAPVALAHSATVFALANGASAPASTATLIQGAMKIMAWTKIKTGIVSAVAVAALTVPLLVKSKSRAELNAGEMQFRGQSEQLEKLRADNARLAQVAGDASLTLSQLQDLRQLQNEIGPLRQQTNELAALQTENRQLRKQTGQDQPKPPGQIKAEATAKMIFQKQWLMQFILFAQKHGGQFPAGFDELGSGVANSIANHDTVSTSQFDFVYHGNAAALTNPANTMVLREKDAWNAGASSHPTNQWAKIYGFADGHVEIHQELENNFDDYEEQHLIPPPANEQ